MLGAAPPVAARESLCVGVGRQSSVDHRGVQAISPGLTFIQTTLSEKQQLRALAYTSPGHAPVSQLAFYLQSTAV